MRRELFTVDDARQLIRELSAGDFSCLDKIDATAALNTVAADVSAGLASLTGAELVQLTSITVLSLMAARIITHDRETS